MTVPLPGPAVRRLCAALSRPVTCGDDLRALDALCDECRNALDVSELAVLEQALTGSDPVLRLSVLAAVTGDFRHYEHLLSSLDLSGPLDPPWQIFWGINWQIFVGRMTAETGRDFCDRQLSGFYRRLVEAVREGFRLAPVRRAPAAPATGRAVMVTNQFLSLRHQPSRDLLSYAAMLEDSGWDVVILNTNMLPADLHSLFVPPFAGQITGAFDGKQVIAVEGREYRMLSHTGRGLSADKLGWFVSAIDWYDPDAVVAMGTGVLVADLLAGVRPTLTISTTQGGRNALSDIILDFGGGTAPPNLPAWRPFTFYFSHRSAVQTDGPAEDVSLPTVAGDFVCLVVGNRLDAEADHAFIAMLERSIDAAPMIRVLFAGTVQTLPQRLARSRHAGRLHALGYVDDMAAVYAAAHAFVNPRRTGGGASAAEAAGAGLVILTLPGCDVAAAAGTAGVLPDYNAFEARLAGLAASGPTARAPSPSPSPPVQDRGEAMRALNRYLEEAKAIFAAGGYPASA